MKNLFTILFTTFYFSATYAQLGINTDGSAPHSSAILDVKSTLKAFYPPRMTTAEKDAIVGKQAGAVVYDITLGALSFYNGSAWMQGGGSAFTMPYMGSAAVGSNGYVLDIANTTGSDGSAIIGRNSTVISGEGIAGIALATSPLSFVSGVFGRSNSTNSNGAGVRAFHAGTGPAFLGNTTNGIGATLNSTNGFALKTQGKLQFSGNGVGTLGIGKFLKSTSANGDAEWADLIPISEVKSSNNNLIYLENTLASNNLAVIAGTTNSSTTGAGIIGTASNTAPTDKTVGIRGINKSTNFRGIGVEGIHEGTGYGGSFESTNGVGLRAISNSSIGIIASSTGNSAGQFRTSNGLVALDVFNNNFSDDARAIEAQGSTGVYGSGEIAGVHGYTFRNIGVYGEASTISGVLQTIGVYGKSIENNGGIGVSGEGKSMGVFGKSITGTGVYGESDGIFGIGISGYSAAGTAAQFDAPNKYALITKRGNVGIGVPDPAYILDTRSRVRIRHTLDNTPDDNTAGIWYNNSANVEGAFSGMKTDTEVGLFLGGNWRFWVNSAGQGYLNGALIQTSDKRLKKDFAQLNNSLTDIYKLNGYHFRWIEEARNKELQTGFIAQEVQKIFPELVQTDDKGFLSVNYIGLIPHLIEAVKELKKENNSLKNENNSFKNNQTNLESRVYKMETLLNSLIKNTASN
jgi:hypothetical protein